MVSVAKGWALTALAAWVFGNTVTALNWVGCGLSALALAWYYQMRFQVGLPRKRCYTLPAGLSFPQQAAPCVNIPNISHDATCPLAGQANVVALQKADKQRMSSTGIEFANISR